jgi:hypothetical protein
VSGYYTALLQHSGILDNVSIQNTGADTLYNLPALPGVGVFQVVCKGNLTDLRRILHLSLAKGNPK